MAVPFALEALAALLGAGALLLSVAGTLHAARWARAPVSPSSAWRPFATVLVPCKGEHQGFEDNARAMAAQDYPGYELLFVVDEKDDPCALALERLRLEGLPCRVLLSEPEVVGDDWSTGKVVAQLTGVRYASEASEVLVFADADARPGPGWLAAMVAPLAEPHVGGVTGYRWYWAPSRPTFWTALRDAWNAVGLDAMTMARFRFLWGGSMAVRKRDFARMPIADEWRRHVSEDVGLTRAVQALGLEVAFAPGALVASPEDWGRREVLEWVVRQTALTRASMPGLWRFAVAVYAASLALLALGLALALAWPTPLLGLAGLAMLAPVLSAAPRAWLRERLVRRVLPAAERPAGQRSLVLLLSMALPAFMLWALARSRRVAEIPWRGRTYPLVDEG